jgi:hypothetical protein
MQTRQVKLPFSNAFFDPRKRIFTTKTGRGMGSVLLNTGGPGGASSYQSVEEYRQITGVDPYARSRKKPVQMGGQGLSDRLGPKLSKLNINSNPKKKNITMSF